MAHEIDAYLEKLTSLIATNETTIIFVDGGKTPSVMINTMFQMVYISRLKQLHANEQEGKSDKEKKTFAAFLREIADLEDGRKD